MSPLSSIRAGLRRLRRFERRELAEFLRWLESTQNFLHVSLLLCVPLVVGMLTFLSNTVDLLPFLLFPPLASGAYTLFANPKSRYASPRRFVGGMTVGALCGWLALELTAGYWSPSATETFQVNPGAAAFGLLLTGLVTWAFHIEEAQAYSTSLIVLVTGSTQLIYVGSIFLSSVFVAGIFVLWRRHIYERRAEFLYQTIHDDDDVLVPVRGAFDPSIAAFAAQLAGALQEGNVVLFDVVPESALSAQETPDTADATRDGETAMPATVRNVARRLETRAADLTREYNVPCDVVVATGDPDNPRAVVQTARETGCDLVVTPYESTDDELSRFVQGLFDSRLDVVAVRTDGTRSTWNRIMVPVRSPSDVAHAMLDFADRLADSDGAISVCRCVDTETDRREAESMLADLAGGFEGAFETRVAVSPIEQYLEATSPNYDLTIVGSSTDRTVASRFMRRPTFQKLDDLDCDIAIVHRGRSYTGRRKP